MSLQKTPPDGMKGVNKNQIHWEEDLKPFTRLPRERRQAPHQRAPWWIPALVSAAAIFFACSTLYGMAQRALPARMEIQEQLNAMLNPTATRAFIMATTTSDIRPTATFFVAATQSAPTSSSTRPAATSAPPPAAASSSGLMKGGWARVTAAEGANFRQSPSASGPRTVLATGSIHQIIDGPVNTEGYIWWQLRTPEGATGWTVDGNIAPSARPSNNG